MKSTYYLVTARNDEAYTFFSLLFNALLASSEKLLSDSIFKRIWWDIVASHLIDTYVNYSF